MVGASQGVDDYMILTRRVAALPVSNVVLFPEDYDPWSSERLSCCPQIYFILTNVI